MTLCLFSEPDYPEWHEERAHLVVEDDNGSPFISGCDCALARDHYDTRAVPATPAPAKENHR